MANWHRIGGAALVFIGVLAFLVGIFMATLRGGEYPPNDYTDQTLFGAFITILGLAMIFLGLHLMLSNPKSRNMKGI